MEIWTYKARSTKYSRRYKLEGPEGLRDYLGLIQYINQLAYRFLSARIIGELSLSPPQAAPGLAS